jgi:hypothetical protein
MSHIAADRILETTTTTGTGTLSLAGAITGYRDFDSVMATNDTCFYALAGGSEWEVGLGTFTSGTPDTLARTTVLASSNGGSAVNLSAGTKEVWMDVPASALGFDSSGKITPAMLASPPVATVKIQAITSSGTYTPSAGMLYCIIECWGGGGGGGGAATTTTGFTSGGGGGAGGKSRKVATAAAVGASQTVTIGTAGAAGTAGANNGGAGGDTSVGTLCVGKGGSGGAGAAANNGGAGGTGGVAGTGDVTGTGQNGSTGVGAAIQTVGAYTNAGASTDVGGGGQAPTQTTGIAGTGFGSGGSGGNTFSTAVAGGAGRPGLVVITEFCSQ